MNFNNFLTLDEEKNVYQKFDFTYDSGANKKETKTFTLMGKNGYASKGSLENDGPTLSSISVGQLNKSDLSRFIALLSKIYKEFPED